MRTRICGVLALLAAGPLAAPAAAQSVVATVPIGTSPIGATSPIDVDVDPTTGRVYVANIDRFLYPYGGSVSVISAGTNTELSRVSIPIPYIRGLGFNAANGKLYVGAGGDGWTATVVVVSGCAIEQSFAIPEAGAIGDIEANPATNRIYVADRRGAQAVTVIDGETHAILATVPVGLQPFGIGVNPSTNRIYVGRSAGTTVAVIDGATNAVVASIPVGSNPTSIGVNPNTDRVYVATRSVIVVIDGATNAILGSVGPFGGSFGDLLGLVVDPAVNRIYVAEWFEASVKVIDGATNAVIATVPLRFQPAKAIDLAADPLTGRVYVPYIGGAGGILVIDGGTGVQAPIAATCVDNAPPVATCGSEKVVEAGAPVVLDGSVADFDGGTLSFAWEDDQGTTLDAGAVSAPAGGDAVEITSRPLSTGAGAAADLGLGDHVVTFTVTDDNGDASTCTLSVRVIDTVAPTLDPKISCGVLWPPNHKLHPVSILANASDASGGPVHLNASVQSSEPPDTTAGGHTPLDWTDPVIDQATGELRLELRAERAGKGPGRIYAITITATDASGNASTAAVSCVAPRDRRAR